MWLFSFFHSATLKLCCLWVVYVWLIVSGCFLISTPRSTHSSIGWPRANNSGSYSLRIWLHALWLICHDLGHSPTILSENLLILSNEPLLALRHGLDLHLPPSQNKFNSHPLWMQKGLNFFQAVGICSRSGNIRVGLSCGTWKPTPLYGLTRRTQICFPSRCWMGDVPSLYFPCRT
jgi:hypothetical protein